MKIHLDLEGAGPDHCVATTMQEGSCQFLCTRRVGTEWFCSIFQSSGGVLPEDAEMRLLRLPECRVASDLWKTRGV